MISHRFTLGLFIFLALSCGAALPGAIRRELAVRKTVQVLTAECAGYSERIRALHGAEDARLRGVQKGRAYEL